MAASPQYVTLNRSQYGQFNDLYNSFGNNVNLGAPVGDYSPKNGADSYQVPIADYTKAYNFLSKKNALNGLDVPSPDGIAGANGLGAESAQPGSPSNLKTPTYDEFVASQANRGPLIYDGSTAPAGMNAGDAQLLKSIYTPHPQTQAQVPVAPVAAVDPAKAAGGFVPEAGLGSTPQGFAKGGMPSSGEMSSWTTRREASDSVHHNGLFDSPVPGRTDKLDTLVPAGSYVVPADVVSGLGEGNTMAGSNILDKMFSTGPFGMKIRNVGSGGVGIPGAPGAPHPIPAPKASGGVAPTRIIAAGGEYLIHPDAVKRLGGGDMRKGHKILDHFVVHARQQTVKETKKLPGPKKS